jgi:glycosyltransferase involved in cell wall biosynthesis
VTTLSVIVPTQGRRSLPATLASIAEQLLPGDEMLVLCSNDNDFGDRARQSLIERARGSHLAFLDDDDQFAYGALAAMRRFAHEYPGRIGIFRIRYRDGRLLWREPVLRRGNVSTQMFCVPNVPGKLGTWASGVLTSKSGRRYNVSDYHFITETVALQGDPVFREEVVAHIRSDRRRRHRIVPRAVASVAALRRRALRRTGATPSGSGKSRRPTTA